MMNDHPNHDTDADEEYDAFGEPYPRDPAELRRIAWAKRLHPIQWRAWDKRCKAQFPC